MIRLVSFFAKNEQEKINIFMAGLNPAVRTIVTSASHTRYGQLVEAATRVEQSAQTALKSKSQFSQKRSWTGSHLGEASRCLRVVSAQHGHRVGSRVRDPRPVRVLFSHQQGPGASRVGGADQCAVDVADHIPVSVFRAGLGVSDAAKKAIS